MVKTALSADTERKRRMAEKNCVELCSGPEATERPKTHFFIRKLFQSPRLYIKGEY